VSSSFDITSKLDSRAPVVPEHWGVYALPEIACDKISDLSLSREVRLVECLKRAEFVEPDSPSSPIKYRQQRIDRLANSVDN
jgi:hypothetical protein